MSVGGHVQSYSWLLMTLFLGMTFSKAQGTIYSAEIEWESVKKISVLTLYCLYIPFTEIEPVLVCSENDHVLTSPLSSLYKIFLTSSHQASNQLQNSNWVLNICFSLNSPQCSLNRWPDTPSITKTSYHLSQACLLWRQFKSEQLSLVCLHFA